jgi:hypothetical protein
VVGGGHGGGVRLADGGGLCALLRCRSRKEDGWAGWAKRPSGPAGCWADWAESQGKLLSESNMIFEFTKALEICTRRIRMNFDVRIFPKFF